MPFSAMAHMSFLCKSSRPSGRFFWAIVSRALLVIFLAFALRGNAVADDIHSASLAADFTVARESVVEAIEGAGLVVTVSIPFNQMLARTAADLGKAGSPYADAEIIQFCSARLAWQLVEEDRGQLALCPLSIAVYSVTGESGTRLAYRSPGRGSPGRARADDLLRDLVARARKLAGQ
jgi:uncharacterized protein (DUF302 family)